MYLKGVVRLWCVLEAIAPIGLVYLEVHIFSYTCLTVCLHTGINPVFCPRFRAVEANLSQAVDDADDWSVSGVR